MGFMDKAKQMAEQAQQKIDEAQKKFNESQQQRGGDQNAAGSPAGGAPGATGRRRGEGPQGPACHDQRRSPRRIVNPEIIPRHA